ncbi:MAG: hypothetical protein PSV18_06530 [Methylobacter sp.]|nr:hypothetical protein [Candidatus Methylobacter titanis]
MPQEEAPRAYVTDVQYENDFQTDALTHVTGALLAHRLNQKNQLIHENPK